MGRLIAGAMSGTSADGVDVAVVEVAGRGADMSARLVRHEHRPFPLPLRQAIHRIRQAGLVELAPLARCGREISLEYAMAVRQALREAGLRGEELQAVAAHGQTLFHAPPDTMQWLDPALLAAEVGCAVVSDFRRADCAAGGQGAPLVPFADYVLFRDRQIDRAIVNIGGIANITCLPAGAGLDRVRAFDTGPGNCISDYLMREHDPHGPGMDLDGRLASRGSPARELADEFHRNPFFSVRGPKSTDGPEMVRLFLEARDRIGSRLNLEDQLATACAITASEIRGGLWPFGMSFSGEVVVAGGGTRNRKVMEMLELCLGRVRTTDEFGMPAEAREAVAFALLAAATLDGIPSNVPSCTGARRAVVLGSITPPP